MYKKPDRTLPEIGARLALTRCALGLTRFQMARLLGTDMPTWGTYEAGVQRIRVDRALKLSAYGIPLEWVYQGKTANLHPHIGAKIRELQAAGHEERQEHVRKAPPKRGFFVRRQGCQPGALAKHRSAHPPLQSWRGWRLLLCRHSERRGRKSPAEAGLS